ncbi:MAG: AI-2E family transporter [Pseudomonadota bacterium]
MLLRYFRNTTEPAHLSVLRNVPLFSGLPTHELQTLDDLLHQRSYVSSEIIFDQNEEGQAIYFVLSGKVFIYRQNQPDPIAELGAGLFFGERALLADLPRVAQAKAGEDCVLAVLFRDDFLNLLKTHPQIAAKITEHATFRDLNQPLASEESSNSLSTTPNVPGPVTWLGILAATCLTLFAFKTILWLVVPFLLALILYYLLSPIAKKMVQSGFSHQLTAVSLSGAFLFAIGLAVLLFYPLTMANAEMWQASLIRYLSGGAVLLDQILQGMQQRFAFLHNAKFGQDIYLEFKDFSDHFSDKYLGSLLLSLAAWLPSLLLAPVITFFMLKDGASMRKMLGGAVPNAFFEKTLYLIHAIDRTARLYFVGLMKMTIVDALIMALVFWILGLHYALLLGLIVAILCWIPYLGPILGFAIVMMVTASDFPGNTTMLYGIVGLFITMRVLDDFVLLPLIIGKSLRIHPLLTVMMFLVGEAIAGIPGLMLAIPILGVVMVLGETLEIILTDKRLRARYRHSQTLAWQAASQDLTIK